MIKENSNLFLSQILLAHDGALFSLCTDLLISARTRSRFGENTFKSIDSSIQKNINQQSQHKSKITLYYDIIACKTLSEVIIMLLINRMNFRQAEVLTMVASTVCLIIVWNTFWKSNFNSRNHHHSYTFITALLTLPLPSYTGYFYNQNAYSATLSPICWMMQWITQEAF